MFGVRSYHDCGISSNTFLRFTTAPDAPNVHGAGTGDILLNTHSHIFSIESRGSGSAMTVLIPSMSGHSTFVYFLAESPKQVYDKLQAFEAHQDALMKAAHENEEFAQPHLPIMPMSRGISQGALRRAKMRVRGQDIDTADYDIADSDPVSIPTWDPFA